VAASGAVQAVATGGAWLAVLRWPEPGMPGAMVSFRTRPVWLRDSVAYAKPSIRILASGEWAQTLPMIAVLPHPRMLSPRRPQLHTSKCLLQNPLPLTDFVLRSATVVIDYVDAAQFYRSDPPARID
jgi:hypothetical protein